MAQTSFLHSASATGSQTVLSSCKRARKCSILHAQEGKENKTWVIFYIMNYELFPWKSFTAWAIKVFVSLSYCSKIHLRVIPFHSSTQQMLFECLLCARHCEWCWRYKTRWGNLMFIAAVSHSGWGAWETTIWLQLPPPQVSGVLHMPHWHKFRMDRTVLLFPGTLML